MMHSSRVQDSHASCLDVYEVILPILEFSNPFANPCVHTFSTSDLLVDQTRVIKFLGKFHSFAQTTVI